MHFLFLLNLTFLKFKSNKFKIKIYPFKLCPILNIFFSIGQSLNGYILILNLLNLNFRKVKVNKNKKCICNK